MALHEAGGETPPADEIGSGVAGGMGEEETEEEAEAAGAAEQATAVMASRSARMVSWRAAQWAHSHTVLQRTEATSRMHGYGAHVYARPGMK